MYAVGNKVQGVVILSVKIEYRHEKRTSEFCILPEVSRRRMPPENPAGNSEGHLPICYLIAANPSV